MKKMPYIIPSGIRNSVDEGYTGYFPAKSILYDKPIIVNRFPELLIQNGSDKCGNY